MLNGEVSQLKEDDVDDIGVQATSASAVVPD